MSLRVEPVKQQQASVQMRMMQPRAMVLGVQRPTLTVLPPSRGELQMGSATVLCVASGGFPSDWTLGWKVGGASTERSHSSVVMRGDGLYSHIRQVHMRTHFSCSMGHSLGLTELMDVGSTATHPDRPAPSRGELQMGSATVLCVASGGFPSDWTLGWKVGGASTERSHSSVVMRGDGLYSHISVLKLSTERWRDASVSCEAHRSGQSPVTESLEPLSCSQ
ncbi:hypothetical protein WMY93_032269 [Mugilogobius chulae]|uniref:Ig-like domain-containing protein n=1 Tax=Mugilogobius chulae TaxID=88201 RepID=A0AAW0MJY1_9GOBI